MPHRLNPQSLLNEPRSISQAICDLYQKAADTGDAGVLNLANRLYHYALTRKVAK